MVISHNIYAMNAQRQFKINTKSKAKNTEKLSSGYKINRSADDAAGLSISEKMRNQIRNLTQGINNTEDGIALIKTAEQALQESQNILKRMHELAVQAANDVNSIEDRQAIQNEIDSLYGEIDDIANKTQFNGKFPLVKKSNEVNLGEKIGERTEIGISRKILHNTIHNNNDNLGATPNGNIQVNTDDEGLYFSWTGYDGMNYISNKFKWGDNIKGNYNINLSDIMDYDQYPNSRGIDFTYSFDVNNGISKDELVDFLNGDEIQIGAQGYFEPTYIRDDGSVSGLSKRYVVWLNTSYLLKANADIESEDYECLTANGTGISYNSGKENHNVEYEFSFHIKNSADIVSGDNSYAYLNKGGYYYESDSSYDGLVELLQLREENEELKNSDCDIGIFSGLMNNGEAMFPVTAVYYLHAGEDASNALYEFSHLDRIDYHLIPNSTETNFLCSVEYNYEHTVPVYENENESGNMDLWIQSGANAGEGMFISTVDATTSGIGLNNINVLSHQSASNSMEKIDNALKKVSEYRSQFGAQQNRLEYTIEHELNYSENLQNAESNLRDTDMAKEILEYSKNSILEQAAQSMISQANQQNQGMLQLLQ